MEVLILFSVCFLSMLLGVAALGNMPYMRLAIVVICFSMSGALMFNAVSILHFI